MYFTSVVLLNSPYFYKEMYNLFNILTFWCERVFCHVFWKSVENNSINNTEMYH